MIIIYRESTYQGTRPKGNIRVLLYVSSFSIEKVLTKTQVQVIIPKEKHSLMFYLTGSKLLYMALYIGVQGGSPVLINSLTCCYVL